MDVKGFRRQIIIKLKTHIRHTLLCLRIWSADMARPTDIIGQANIWNGSLWRTKGYFNLGQYYNSLSNKLLAFNNSANCAIYEVNFFNVDIVSYSFSFRVNWLRARYKRISVAGSRRNILRTFPNITVEKLQIKARYGKSCIGELSNWQIWFSFIYILCSGTRCYTMYYSPNLL